MKPFSPGWSTRDLPQNAPPPNCHSSLLSVGWSGMDSNVRFRARMATVPSLRALSISLKLFGFRLRTRRPQRPKFRIHFPPAASRANYDRVIVALNGATWGSVPIVVT